MLKSRARQTLQLLTAGVVQDGHAISICIVYQYSTRNCSNFYARSKIQHETDEIYLGVKHNSDLSGLPMCMHVYGLVSVAF